MSKRFGWSSPDSWAEFGERTDGDYVLHDDHIKALAACAAGPWRTDVENAPKDRYFWAMIRDRWSVPLVPTVLRWSEAESAFFSHHFGCVRPKLIAAFALINPPESLT